MPRLRAATLAPLALAAALSAPLTRLAWRVAEAQGASRPYEVRVLPEGRALSFLPAGVKLSIANAYWLATVQYVGDQHLSKGRFERLLPLVDLVTDLDPRHGYAYQTAGLNLSSAGRLEESDRILKKGMTTGPNWWSYPFYLAFNDYFYRGDYAAAARWARVAAQTPGASTNIAHLALALEVKAGDPAGGLALIETLLATASEPDVRERLEQQHKLARLQVAFAAIDDAAARYRARTGLPPLTLHHLLRSGALDALPDEPFGGRFYLDADGRAASTGEGFRFRPRDRPHAAAAAPAKETTP